MTRIEKIIKILSMKNNKAEIAAKIEEVFIDELYDILADYDHLHNIIKWKNKSLDAAADMVEKLKKDIHKLKTKGDIE